MADSSPDRSDPIVPDLVPALICAIRENDEDLVQALLMSGADPNLEDTSGQSAVGIAAENGSIDTVKYLIEAGAEVDVAKDSYQAPLVQAAVAGHLDIVRLIMRKGAPHSRILALSKATSSGHLDIVKELIRLPQDIFIERPESDTSFLALAVEGGHTEIVKFLLDNGALKPKLKSRYTSPLSRAASKGHLLIMKLLVEAGADLAYRNPLGNTPLMVACYHGHEKAVVFLSSLMSRQDIDISNDNSMTALHYALAKAEGVDIMTPLLNRGADPDLAYRGSLSPLHIALHRENPRAIIRLLEHEANPNVADAGGEAPIHLVISKDYVSLIESFAKADANLDLRNTSGFAAIHLAVFQRSLNLVNGLLKSGSDPNCPGPLQISPLHLSAMLNFSEVIEPLIKAGAGIDVVTYDGKTPLHHATADWSTDAVRVLLASKSDPHVVDGYGQTALDYSYQGENGSQGMHQIRRQSLSAAFDQQGHRPATLEETIATIKKTNLDIIHSYTLKGPSTSEEFILCYAFRSLISCCLLQNDIQATSHTFAVWSRLWKIRYDKTLPLHCRACRSMITAEKVYQCATCLSLVLCLPCFAKNAPLQGYRHDLLHKVVQMPQLGDLGSAIHLNGPSLFQDVLSEALFARVMEGSISMETTATAIISEGVAHLTVRDTRQTDESISPKSMPDQSSSMSHVSELMKNSPRSLLSTFENWESLEALNQAISFGTNALSKLHIRSPLGEREHWRLLLRMFQRWFSTKEHKGLNNVLESVTRTLSLNLFSRTHRAASDLTLGACWKSKLENSDTSVSEYDRGLEAFRITLSTTDQNLEDRIALFVLFVGICRRRFDCTKSSFPALSHSLELIEKFREQYMAIAQDKSSDNGLPRSEDVDLILADLFKLDYDRRHKIESLNKAIVYMRNVVNGDPEACKQLGSRPTALNEMLVELFEFTGLVPALREGIEVLRTFLDNATDATRKRALGLNNLAHDLRLLHKIRKDENCLDEASRLVQEALRIMRQYPPEQSWLYYGEMWTNYGNILGNKYDQYHRVNDLEASIKASEEALKLGGTSNDTRAVRLTNLASAYRSKFERSQASEELFQSLKLSEEALELPRCSKETKCLILFNFCQVLYLQLSRGSKLRAKYDQLVRLSKVVVGSATASSQYVKALHNLSTYLLLRYKEFQDEEDLQQSIAYELKCLRQCSVRQVERQTFISGLGNRYEELYVRGKNKSDLDVAIALYDAALRLNPINDIAIHNFAAATMRRWRLTEEREDLALTADRFEARLRLTSAPFLARIRGGHAAALFAMFLHEWSRAASLFREVMVLLPQLYENLTRRDDLQYVLGMLSELPDRLTASFIEADQPLSDLLEHLEGARGIIAYLTVRSDNRSSAISPAGKDHFGSSDDLRFLVEMEAFNDISPASYPDLEMENNGSVQTQSLVQNFARRVSVEEATALAIDGPIVDFAVTQFRSDAIIITEAGVRTIQLHGLLEQDLKDAISHVIGENRVSKGSSVDHFERNRKLKRMLGWLWLSAVRPVLETLQFLGSRKHKSGAVPQVRWISSSLVGSLPLHAAGDCLLGSMENTMDHVISTYIPSLKGLRFALKKLESCTSRGVHSGLFVGMPHTPGWPDISVNEELEALRKLCPQTTCLLNPSAGKAIAALQIAEVCHFACHGLMDPEDPSNAQLILGDEQPDPITARQLSANTLPQAQILYLAACSTAENSAKKLVGEVLHLATAFQLAGFPNVVGALWEVDSVAAASIACKFYEGLSEAGNQYMGRKSVARALHEAIKSYRRQHDDDLLGWVPQILYGP